MWLVWGKGDGPRQALYTVKGALERARLSSRPGLALPLTLPVASARMECDGIRSRLLMSAGLLPGWP